jgi:hypothetical protein
MSLVLTEESIVDSSVFNIMFRELLFSERIDDNYIYVSDFETNILRWRKT